MRFLTPEAALERLTSDKNTGVYYANGRSHGKVTNHLSLDEKVLVNSMTKVLPVRDVAELFGINESTASAIKNGKKVSAQGFAEDRKLQEKVKPVEDDIVKRSTDLVMAALGEVEKQKMLERTGNKLRDVTGAAKDIASIIDKIRPKEEGGKSAAVVFVQTAPFDESRYTTIIAKA